MKSYKGGIRFGLCCLFCEVPIKYRAATVAYLRRMSQKGGKPLDYLSEIVEDNLKALQLSLAYCAEHEIGSFRIGSRLLPLYTHPEFGYEIKDLADPDSVETAFKKCREFAQENRIRLIFHPDQFVVLNSPLPQVVKNSIAELEYHALMAEKLGADVINIHGGGAYGDKKGALKRFEENFHLLSKRVRSRLTVENDDKIYTPSDLLPLCLKLKIPLVYDVHHHACLPDALTVEEASCLAYKTWDREPLFHISSPLGGWGSPKPQMHHDYIDADDFPDCWFDLLPLTVEVEAKAKELAVAKLKQDLAFRNTKTPLEKKQKNG